MLAVKGRYNGSTVVFDKIPQIKECEVIVNFPDIPASVKPSEEPRPIDDGSIAYLFKDYIDDGIREPIIDFGATVGNERW